MVEEEQAAGKKRESTLEQELSELKSFVHGKLQ
jgi:hypothetical protein